MGKNILHFLLVILLSVSTYARDKSLETEIFNDEFKEIIFDVRGSRGGNGDVAAGYLTIIDLVNNYKVTGNITVLVDENSERILTRLSFGNNEFLRRVTIEHLDTLPAKKVFDLYIALANPSGTFHYENQIIRRKDQELEQVRAQVASKKQINMYENSVMLVQTVLGNSENIASVNPFAAIRSKGINYDIRPAGYGFREAGIYNDYVASELRNKPVEEIKKYIIEEAKNSAISEIISGSKLKNSKIGLAYGISSETTKPQFTTYLQGLDDHLKRHPGESFTIITPSAFSLSHLPSNELYTRMILIESGFLPDVAEPGKIYIIKTSTLPHKIFVGLMAYSMKAGLVPVGAGDGFISAAINLGGPFALTKVRWNEQNIKNLKERLLEISRGTKQSLDQAQRIRLLLNRVYRDIDLRTAQDLHQLTPFYQKLGPDIPDLSDRIMNSLVSLRMREGANRAYPQYKEDVLDSSFKFSLQLGGLPKQIRYIATFIVRYLTHNNNVGAKNHTHNLAYKKLLEESKIIQSNLEKKESRLNRMMNLIKLKLFPSQAKVYKFPPPPELINPEEFVKSVKSLYKIDQDKLHQDLEVDLTGQTCSKLFQM